MSRIVCQYASQDSRLAYSVKQSGNRSSPNLSKMAGSDAFACPMNFADG